MTRYIQLAVSAFNDDVQPQATTDIAEAEM